MTLELVFDHDDERVNESAAMALARFLKRLAWEDVMRRAESDSEIDLMNMGLEAVRSSLAKAGYSPQ